MEQRVTIFAYQRHDSVTLIPVAQALDRAGIPYQAIVIENGNRQMFEGAGIHCKKEIKFNVVPGSVIVMASDLMGRQHELGRYMVDLHRKHGARSLSVQHASYLLYENNPRCHFAADVCCVGGTADYDHYKRLGYDECRLRLTGMPKYDVYVPQKCGCPEGDKVLVANVGHEESRRVGQDLVRKLMLAGYDLTIREHPTENLLRSSGNHSKVGFTLDDVEYSNPLLPLVHDLKCHSAVLTTSPSVAFEALAFGVPACYLDMTWPMSCKLRELKKCGLTVCPNPWSPDGVGFDDTPEVDRYLLHETSFGWDGHAADRVVRVIREAINA